MFGGTGVTVWGYSPRNAGFGGFMPLTDTAVKKAKPGAAPTKLSDGKGMYL
jgi:hypothetical protein